MADVDTHMHDDPGPDRVMESMLDRLGSDDRARTPASLLDRIAANPPGPSLRLVGTEAEVKPSHRWRLNAYGLSGLAAAAMIALAVVVSVTGSRPSGPEDAAVTLAAAQEDLEALLAFEEEFDDLFALGLDDEFGEISDAVSAFESDADWSPDETVFDLEFGAVTEPGGLG